MITKLKLYSLSIPIPNKTIPFIAAEWAPSPRVALKHSLRKAFRCRGIKSFWIDGKEFDTHVSAYTYIVKNNRIPEFIKESSQMK